MPLPEGYIEANALEIADKILKIASEAKNEEELRIRVEHTLREVLDKLGIAWASYEFRTGKGTLVEGRRVDALYGRVIIEYEKPKTFESTGAFEKAKKQVIDYIEDLSGKSVELYPKYFGVALDGFKIGFIRFKRGWEHQGPFDVNKQTVLKLLEAIRGLRRKPLRADLLNKDLGPGSYVAKVVVNVLYQKLMQTKKPRVEMLFDDWRRVFRQVCGYSPEKIKGLEDTYGVKGEVDYEALLFSVHTYFALVMKLLAAEVAVSMGDSYLRSYIKIIEDAYLKGPSRLKEMLKELEEGDIFTRALGIRNFLEADYFAWYLDVWDERLAEEISKLAKVLSDYEPATVELEPDEVKDMLKRLYQYLVPKKIRHDLGEYYTSDWLAELVLNEVDYRGDLDKRLLDPACGSGTFLVLAIKRAKEYAQEHFIDESDTLKKILKNIVGFDLNPLAVLAARTNYLIALGDLIRYRGIEGIEIPIYLADSILVERRSTLAGTAYVLRTSVGEFMIPSGIIDRGLLANILGIIEECVKGGYTQDEFKARLLREVNVDETEASILIQLYNVLLKLEKEGRNRIWVRVLRNSFAPLFAGKFQYIVGNPPWVAWENLPDEYRASIKELCAEYGILPVDPNAQAKMDISMIFVFRCIDRYLTDTGDFGFLITQTVFKSIAGEGFRKFHIHGQPLGVVKVHDMVDLKPFEGAQNRTAAIIIKRGLVTEYPVHYFVWRKIAKQDISQTMSLNDVQRLTTKANMFAEPLGGYQRQTRQVAPWMHVSNAEILKKLRTLIKPSLYRAQEGTNTRGANGIFWVEVKEAVPAGVFVSNLGEKGKKKYKTVTSCVDAELIYPLLRGSGIQRWRASPENYILLPFSASSGKILSEHHLKVMYPKSYQFLLEFKEDLESRRLYGKEIKVKYPFYTVFQVNEKTYAPYKVVWREVALDFNTAVVGPVNDPYLGNRIVIPAHTVVMIPFANDDEAHFVCAILNSSVARLIVKSYLHLHPSPHVLNYVNVPTYDSNNKAHKILAGLSKEAHRLATRGEEAELAKVEEQIDMLVAQLYSLTEEELEEVKESLKNLEGKVVEAEEVAEEVVEESKPKTTRKRAVERLIEEFKEEKA